MRIIRIIVLGVFGAILASMVIPTMYRLVVGAAPVTVGTAMATGKQLVVGDRLEMGGRLYAVSKPLDLQSKMREVDYNLGALPSALMHGQYVTPVKE